MRRIILGFSLAGTLLFGFAFALSWQAPVSIERLASAAVRYEVERKVGERIDTLSGAPIVGFAQRALGRTDAEMARTRDALRMEVPAQVARVATAMLDPDCACRARLAAAFQAGARQHLQSLSDARARLVSLIESAYANVSKQLLREWRIFTASNAVACGLLGFVALARHQAGAQLLLPAAALAGGAAVTASLYLFGQDWLHTILFSDYVGLAYAGWLGIVVLLADILANRARVTTRLINAVANMVGAGTSALPC